jgi:predicted DNA-binding protein (MmcQ/YjbR family)
MKTYLYQIAQLICLSFPESEEFLSHGAPNFRIKKGKIFALFADRHHGDAVASLWLNAPPGAQAAWVEQGTNIHALSAKASKTRPQGTYFVPPYLGPRGWLGVRLDQDLPWPHIYDLVHEAYGYTAAAKFGRSGANNPGAIRRMPELPPAPSAKAIAATRIDAELAQQKYLAPLRKMLSAWPEVVESTSYDQLAWRAGKKPFVQLLVDGARTGIAFLVDGETLSMLLEDPRFFLPRFIGARGWVAFDVRHPIDWQELGEYLLASYRNVALKRMLLVLASAHSAQR